MLFLGFGTGLGAAVIMNGNIEALELGRFYYKKRTLEYYLGNRGLKRLGRKKWQCHVEEIVERVIAALKPDDVVLGGGNVKYLKRLPPGTRAGNNANAFLGGFQMWQGEADSPKPSVAGLLNNARNGDEEGANNPSWKAVASVNRRPKQSQAICGRQIKLLQTLNRTMQNEPS